MIDRIDVLEAGIFKKSPSGNLNESDVESPTGYFIRTDNILLVEQTDTVSPALGLVFGIKYVPVSSDENALASFQCKIIHPQLVNPKNDLHFSATVEDKYNYVNEENFDFFEFEHDWEMRDGPWRFQIIEENRLLCEHEFIVRKK